MNLGRRYIVVYPVYRLDVRISQLVRTCISGDYSNVMRDVPVPVLQLEAEHLERAA